MTFLYDYRDEWRFRAEVIGTGQAQPDANYSRIVSKIGKAPPSTRTSTASDDAPCRIEGARGWVITPAQS